MIARVRASIGLKMGLLVLGGTSLIFGLVLGYTYFSTRALILREAEVGARNLAYSVARRVEQEFRAVAKVPEHAACFLETSGPDRETLLKVLKRLVTDSPEVYGSTASFEPYAFDKSIRAVAPYFYREAGGLKFKELSADSYDYFIQDWYHIPKVLRAPVWSEPYFDEGGGNILMVTYSVPFFARGANGAPGEVLGVVTADVSLEWLERVLSVKKVASTGHCFIISDTGAFVAHPRADMVMKESLFSLAEELDDPQLRRVGRAMVAQKAGFVDIGSRLTGTDSFLAYARIRTPKWSLGAVIPKDELLADVRELHHRIVLIASGGVALLLLVSALVARSITKPLRILTDAAESVGNGALDIDVSRITTSDEVGELARAFMHMTEGLKQRDFIRDTFGRYLTKEVVNRLLGSQDGLKLGGEAREISMIMSDLRGFTAIAAHMGPEQVIILLNRYLGKMVEIMMEYRGVIDEIIGDGILAFFGAPEPMEDHPARAVACALTMQRAMEEVNALNVAEGFPRLEMGIAVNTGLVVVGNIGSERRSKYGAVGSEVNFTGRVESFTVGGQILVSQSTYRALNDLLDVRNVLAVEMKGVEGLVNLYDVRGIRGPYQVALEDADEVPKPLSVPVEVVTHCVVAKGVLPSTEGTGRLIAASRTCGILLLASEAKPCDDLRLMLVDAERKPVWGMIYAKVESVSRSGDMHETRIRFTSVSGEAHTFLDQVLAGSA
jgi:class 3 adenylate cyclase